MLRVLSLVSAVAVLALFNQHTFAAVVVQERPATRILAQAPVLSLEEHEGGEKEAIGSIDTTQEDPFYDFYAGANKTSKILSGPSRPRPGPSYGQDGGWGDLTSQGSGNAQSIQNHPSISPIDMQLLSAIEKLVSRMDGLDSRVKTLESVVYFLTGKDKPDDNRQETSRGNCPNDFVKIDGIRGKCYHVSTFSKSQKITDWKTAAGECGRLGGRLAEMLSYSDYHRISSYLAKYTNTRNAVATDFWSGAVNPGLLWIWSESGQKVDLDKRFWNENDNSSNAPGCLKLSYSIRLNTFFFKGAPCAQTQNFLCEVLDNSVSRALASFEKDLIKDDDEDSLEDDKPETLN